MGLGESWKQIVNTSCVCRVRVHISFIIKEHDKKIIIAHSRNFIGIKKYISAHKYTYVYPVIEKGYAGKYVSNNGTGILYKNC